MTDKPDPPDTLDPDEVECPRCHAAPGHVCQTPAGRRARTIHRERRHAAANQHRPPDDRQSPTKTRASRRGANLTSELAAKGGRARAAKKRRERAEIEGLLVDAKARALEARAEELAEDSIAWDRDRMALRRSVLDRAIKAWSTFGEALENYSRIQTDEQGKPTVALRETDTGRVVRELDRRGTFGPDDVKALAIAAGTALDKVRLEEGSATSRQDVNLSGVPGAGYADVSDRDLRGVIERAAEALDEVERNAPEE